MRVEAKLRMSLAVSLRLVMHEFTTRAGLHIGRGHDERGLRSQRLDEPPYRAFEADPIHEDDLCGLDLRRDGRGWREHIRISVRTDQGRYSVRSSPTCSTKSLRMLNEASF